MEDTVDATTQHRPTSACSEVKAALGRLKADRDSQAAGEKRLTEAVIVVETLVTDFESLRGKLPPLQRTLKATAAMAQTEFDKTIALVKCALDGQQSIVDQCIGDAPPPNCCSCEDISAPCIGICCGDVDTTRCDSEKDITPLQDAEKCATDLVGVAQALVALPTTLASQLGELTVAIKATHEKFCKEEITAVRAYLDLWLDDRPRLLELLKYLDECKYREEIYLCETEAAIVDAICALTKVACIAAHVAWCAAWKSSEEACKDSSKGRTRKEIIEDCFRAKQKHPDPCEHGHPCSCEPGA
jgi:hypothetical protein